MQRRPLLLPIAACSLAASLYFGTTSHVTDEGPRRDMDREYTDWGRVALTAVFGAGALGAAFELLRRK